jgi:hypothetical protein
MAAWQCMTADAPVKCGPATFRRDGTYLTIALPSGRLLWFPNAKIIRDARGRALVSFDRIDQ